MFDGALDDFPRINSTGVQCPLKKVLNLHDAILGIKEHDFEDFFFQVSHRMVQVIENLLGGPAIGFIEDLFLKKFRAISCINLITKMWVGPIPLIFSNSSGEASRTPLRVLNFFMASLACGLQSLRGVPNVSSNSTIS